MAAVYATNYSSAGVVDEEGYQLSDDETRPESPTSHSPNSITAQDVEQDVGVRAKVKDTPAAFLTFEKACNAPCGIDLGDSRSRGVVIRRIGPESVLFGQLPEHAALLSINKVPTARGAQAAAIDLVAAGGVIEIEWQPKQSKITRLSKKLRVGGWSSY